VLALIPAIDRLDPGKRTLMKIGNTNETPAATITVISGEQAGEGTGPALPTGPPGFAAHAVRGGVLVGSAQLIRIAVQMASVVVLSRLLAPTDFGLVAAVTPVIGFVSMFQDLGYGQAIVQRTEISQEQISSVFWTTAALGVLCAVITILASPAVAWFYHDRRILLITIAASVPLLLGSLMSVPSGLLNRRLNFRGLAVSDTLGAVSGLACATLAAYLGARYWSLIINSAVSSLVIVAGYWMFAAWKPNKPRARFVEREIGEFGANLTGFSFVNYFARNLDNILIGRKEGSVELGYYDRAYKLLYFPIQNINGPLYRVMTPMLSRVQDDPQRFRAMFLRGTGQLTLFTVPAMAALVAAPHDFVLLVFGARWAPVAPIFFYLGINGLLQPLSNATEWIFIALGRTAPMFRVGLATSTITVISFFIGLHFGGAVGLAAAYAVSEFAFKAPIQYAVVHRMGTVSAWDLCWQQIPLLVAAAFSVVTVRLVFQRTLHMHGLALLVVGLVISYAWAITITAIRPGGRAVLQESKDIIGRLLKRPSSLRG
jgi:O-antigen/teichoic acid export membrane protein